MERTKLKLPDAINCSIPDSYVRVPNELLRNPKLSAKAKTIICILLGNRENWHTYIDRLLSMMLEKKEAVQNGLHELERNGYLKRIRYRNKFTKTIVGSFWAYSNTPFEFDYENQLKLLQRHNLEPIEPEPGNPELANPQCGKPATNNINNNKIKKERKIFQRTKLAENKIIPPTLDMVKNYCEKRNSMIDPETFHNFYKSKGWKIGNNKMVDWHCAIATWEKKEQKENNKNKEPFKINDQNIRFNLCPDGYYRHPRTNELYIP